MISYFIIYSFQGSIIKTFIRTKYNIKPYEKYWYAVRNCPIKDISVSGGLLRRYLLVYKDTYG